MIVRTLDEIVGSARDVKGHGWRSRRLLTKADAMGFSFHDTVLAEGSEQEFEYKHHLEANYCISGEGEVVNVASGKAIPFAPARSMRSTRTTGTYCGRPRASCG